MRDDTGIGGARGRFPTTRLSAVKAAGSRDPGERERGFAAVVAAYWKPVYKYVRLKWREDNEGAKDATQGFFARALEKDWFSGYEPRKGSFRTFLRTCLDGFLANERKAGRRLKRHPGEPLVSLDFESAEGELAEHPLPGNKSPEDFFHEEFARAVFLPLSRSCVTSSRLEAPASLSRSSSGTTSIRTPAIRRPTPRSRGRWARRSPA